MLGEALGASEASDGEVSFSLKDGQTDAATEQLKVVYSRLDRVAAKGTIHKNTASRRKARLTKRLNAAK